MKKKISFSFILTAVFAVAVLSFFSSEVNAQSSCCSKTTSSTTSSCETNESTETNGTSSGIISPDSAVCMVSGEPMESGKGVGLKYLGTEYKFCCPGCVEEFKAEPMNYIEKIQCSVEGGAGKKDVYTMVDGVKYYFCCKGCDKEFSENFDKYKDGFKGDSNHGD